MTVAENLAEDSVDLTFPYRDPTGNVYTAASRRVGAFGGAKSSKGMSAYFTHLMALLYQTWAMSVLPPKVEVQAVSGLRTGSGVLGIAEPLSAVSFSAASIPTWQDRIPGAVVRYPHLGELAFAYFSDDSGGFSLGEPHKIQYANQAFFPESSEAIGFYYRLNVAVQGYFSAWDNGTKRMNLNYIYARPGVPIPEVFTINPYMGDVAETQPESTPIESYYPL